MDVWGADFIRLTMESYGTSQGRTHWQGILLDREYLDDIIEIVDYIKTKPGVYVLLSLWLDPGFTRLGWPTDNTIETWETLAEIFKNDSHVLYGVANEPQSNWSGSLDRDCWEAMNRTAAAIRAVEGKEKGARQENLGKFFYLFFRETGGIGKRQRLIFSFICVI